MDPKRWGDKDALLVAVASKRLGLDEYLLRWWDSARRAAVIDRVGILLAQLSAQGRLSSLALSPEDVAFWQGETPLPKANAPRKVKPDPRQPRTPQPEQRTQWSRTRRNSQAVRNSVGQFFTSLSELLRKKE
jgi:hypothetical protein